MNSERLLTWKSTRRFENENEQFVKWHFFLYLIFDFYYHKRFKWNHLIKGIVSFFILMESSQNRSQMKSLMVNAFPEIFTGRNISSAMAEGYWESSQTSKMELFEKTGNGRKTLTIFAKSFILNVWHDLAPTNPLGEISYSDFPCR